MKFFSIKLRLQILLYIIVILTLTSLVNDTNDNSLKVFLGTSENRQAKIIAYEFITPTPTLTPTTTPTPTLTPTPTAEITPAAAPADAAKPSEWGVAKQVSEHTYTMKVGKDLKMGTPQEILNALNSYRNAHGAGSVSWSENLASFAQDRANSFSSSSKLDEHAGFYSYLENQDNFAKLGFSGIGENSSIGYTIEAVHLIEWVYSADEGHNQNQLNKKWSHVGIGVSGTATDLIFGGN